MIERWKGGCIFVMVIVTAWHKCNAAKISETNKGHVIYDNSSQSKYDGAKENGFTLEECIETLRNYEAANPLAITSTENATTNRATNFTQCIRLFQLETSDGDQVELLDSIYNHKTTNRSSNLADKTEGGDADAEAEYKDAPASTSVADKIKLEFPACPTGDTIIVEALEEYYPPFYIFSNLLGLLQPMKIPIGLLKDALQQRLPFHHLLLQILKLEGPLLAWILLWAILSLCIPCVVIVQICRRAKNLQRLEEHSSGSSMDLADNCSRRVLATTLHFLLFALLLNVILMMGSNEQLSRTVLNSPERIGIILEDVERFIKNTEMQITFVTVSSIETATDAIEKDLDDVEALIGVPFQRDVGSTFGLERIFKILADIKSGSLDASHRVKSVIQTCTLAQEVGKALEERLEELIPLLNNIHQQCSQRDRALCETLVSSGLDVTFHPEQIFTDLKLKYLAGISDNVGFNASVDEAEQNYKDIPRRVAHETELQRAELRNNLHQRRIAIHKALRALEDLHRFSISTIKSWSRKLIPVLEEIASRDVWRYLTILGLTIITFIMWICFMCGAPCGCENTNRAMAYLNSGVAIACIITLLVWTLGSFALILGVHGQNVICDSLYDPKYTLLGELLDDGGWLYPNGGFFGKFLRTDQNINVVHVLRNAERNQSTYTTLKLKSIVDIRSLVNYESWDDVRNGLQTFSINSNSLKILTPNLESFLVDLTAVSKVNMTRHRKEISGPMTARDLNGFMDQAYAVAKQTVDARTGTRIEKLIYKLRNIINNEYRTLKEFKDRILYEVTALEIVLIPLQRNCEYVLNSLRIFQVSIGTNGNDFAQKIIQQYRDRLTSYLQQFQDHVDMSIKHNTAKLGPLWTIFFYTRNVVCVRLIGAMNGFAFSCFFTIFLLLFLVPMSRKLIKYYRELNDDFLNSILRRSTPDLLDSNDQGEWRSPTTNGTPESAARPDESVSASPRHLHEHIPPPPRLPPETRRGPSPRPAVPTISRSRSPFSRYESLKLIERIARRTSGSSSSRTTSWI